MENYSMEELERLAEEHKEASKKLIEMEIEESLYFDYITSLSGRLWTFKEECEKHFKKVNKITNQKLYVDKIDSLIKEEERLENELKELQKEHWEDVVAEFCGGDDFDWDMEEEIVQGYFEELDKYFRLIYKKGYVGLVDKYEY